MQRPQIRAVIDLVRGDRVAVTMAGQKYNFVAVDFAKGQCAGRIAVRGAHDLTPRDIQIGKLG